MSHRIGFVTSHPIQYQAPVFRQLAAMPGVDLTVFFCQLPDERMRGDGFGVSFDWDEPLLSGYPYEVLDNVAKKPSVTSYYGCDTPGIAKRIARDNFDAMIVNGWVAKSCLQTLSACRKNRVPCIVRGEANLIRPRPWWKHFLHRQLIHRYSAFLYIGRANRQFYERHGVRPDRLFPALYCVENDRFARAAAEPERRERGRARWNIPSERVCYVYSGKFIAKKHPTELLRSFAAAVARGANAHLLMVGDGELKAVCENFAAERKLPITFTGFLNQSEIADAYLASDCLVLPSDHGETWGLVVNEAMACGRPAIVSDQVGCREDLVIANETGVSFLFGHWESLTEQFLRLSRDPEGLKVMGQKAADKITTYSPRHAALGMAAAVAFVSRKKTLTRVAT